MSKKPEQETAGPSLEIQRLIDEMTKLKPDAALVKRLMKDAGLKAPDDPIDQLNVLLRALHGDPVDEVNA